jgi:rare lipoprotein A
MAGRDLRSTAGKVRARRPSGLAGAPGFALLLLALAVTGCHKKTQQAYRQPPPPPAEGSTSARTSSGASTSSSTARAGGSEPNPTGQISPELLRGKPTMTEVGLASWYGPPYAGRRGADGSVYDQNAMTAAHLTLPLGSLVRVTNLANNETAVVRITDRGPFVRGRIIDLSLAAAKATGIYRAGVARVRLEAYEPPPRPNGIPGGRWCVQVGAFEKEKDAIKLKEEMLRHYHTAKVIEFEGPTGFWVRINPAYPDRKNADEVEASIHPKGADAAPYLIRTD